MKIAQVIYMLVRIKTAEDNGAAAQRWNYVRRVLQKALDHDYYDILLFGALGHPFHEHVSCYSERWRPTPGGGTSQST